jgi:hypothetical protein
MTAADAREQIPDAVHWAALLAYAQKRWHGVTDIHDPATSQLLDNEVHEEAFNAALASAFRAGAEAALDRDEWRVSSVEPQYSTAESFNDRADAEQMCAVLNKKYGGFWIEHRRVGASGWQKVQP